MIHPIFFSATNTTERIVLDIAAELAKADSSECHTVGQPHSLNHPSNGVTPDFNSHDVAVIGVPVYAGRVPALAAGRLKRVNGRGAKAIVVCVYGNRDFDDALAELCDIAEAQGFTLIAAAAFVAEHCIFPKVATGRPDAADAEKLRQFAALCRQRLANGFTLSRHDVKGNRPYRLPKPVPIHPKASKRRCVLCGACAAQCPTGAISREMPLLTNASKCISCCRCIHVCPHKARSFGGLLYKIAGWKFTRAYSRRHEPQWF